MALTPRTPSLDVVVADPSKASSSLFAGIKPTSKRIVLEEDEYLQHLEVLIQRDYFPDIPKLKAQSEYLEAVERNDVAKIRELQIKYSTRRTDKKDSPTQRRSPETFETPLGSIKRPHTATQNPEAPTEEESQEKAPLEAEPVELDGVTLDKFLSKYTSEDNASFAEMQNLEERRERLRHAWMYRAELEHNRSKVKRGPGALPPADEQLALPAPPQTNLDNWTYTARNSVLFHPEDAPWTEEERVQRMKMNQLKVENENTRFKTVPFSEEAEKERMGRAAAYHAVANRGKFDVQGQQHLGVNRQMDKFSLVATPSPAPGVNESPFMTWGEIEGTPFRLDAADTPIPNTSAPTFKMPEIPLRDKLAQNMTDEIAKKYSAKRKRAIQEAASHHLSAPRFGSTRSTEKLSSMSPAARRLATSKLGIRTGTDKALKASYTPTHKTTQRDATPLVVPSPKSDSPSADSTLTDNLLQLDHNRPKASDYF